MPLVVVVAMGLLGCYRKKIDHAEGVASTEACADWGGDVCKRCASLPRCGWCGLPAAGEAHCQPQGATEVEPSTCRGEWTHNELGCPRPPLDGED